MMRIYCFGACAAMLVTSCTKVLGDYPRDNPLDTNFSGQATCIDAVQNGEETDVDCGGSNCDGCANQDACRANEPGPLTSWLDRRGMDYGHADHLHGHGRSLQDRAQVRVAPPARHPLLRAGP